MIEIYNKEKCCGCAACVATCSFNAIYMKCDEYGNVFPHVDTHLCRNCGKCESVCPITTDSVWNESKEAFAYRLKTIDELKKSSSGGAFFGIATSFIRKTAGVVVGCIYDDKMLPQLVVSETCTELDRMRGSKYVMSTISKETYHKILEYLKEKRKVLFFGVPCQCAAIKNLAKPWIDYLYTIDIICHGFVNQDFWRDYISLLEKKHHGQITDFVFRSKNDRNNFIASYSVLKGKKKRKYRTNPAESYYYNYFLNGAVYRENCYSCKFAKPLRVSDITIGDFWGYKGTIGTEGWLSAVLVNSDRGKEIYELLDIDDLIIERVNVSDIANYNGQLNFPSPIEKKNYVVLEVWKKKGAKQLANEHHRKHWKAYLMSKMGYFR